MIIMKSVYPVACILGCLLSASVFLSTINSLILNIPKVVLLYFGVCVTGKINGTALNFRLYFYFQIILDTFCFNNKE